MSQSRTLIVGIGSPHGDDQAGWLVADRLAIDLNLEFVHVRRANSPAEILDWFDGFERLIVCDACIGLDRIGKVRRLTWPATELDEVSWSGTHDFSLPTVFELAKRLGRLPRNVVIWTVEGTIDVAMAMMSSEVSAALPMLIHGIANEVNQNELCTSDPS